MKKIVTLLLALLILVSLCACGNSQEQQGGSAFDTIVAGYGKVDVTPTAPVHLGSYGDAMTRVSTGVRDEFYAITVAITDSNDNTVLIIMTDLSWGHINQLTEIRARVEKQYGIPGDNILLGGTHNHNGPEWMNEGFMTSKNQLYFNSIWYPGVMESIEMALNDRKPATFEIATTETENVGFVRRYFTSDGSFYGSGRDTLSGTPIEHETEGDEEVQLAYLRREGEGQDILIAQWQNHGCHYGNTTYASTDWIGPMRTEVEEALGCKFIYLQGVAGNMATKSMIKDEYPREKTVAEIASDVATVIIDAAEDASNFTAISKGDAVKIKRVTFTDTTERNGQPFDCEMTIVGVGGLSFITVPVELFAESGIEIKERTPYDMTMIMCYANGICSYVGTELAFQNGGYGVEDGRGNPQTANKMVDLYIDTLTELHG